MTRKKQPQSQANRQGSKQPRDDDYQANHQRRNQNIKDGGPSSRINDKRNDFAYHDNKQHDENGNYRKKQIPSNASKPERDGSDPQWKKDTRKANGSFRRDRKSRITKMFHKDRTFYKNILKINNDTELLIEDRYRSYLKDKDKPHVNKYNCSHAYLSVLIVAEKPSVARRIAEALKIHFDKPFTTCTTKLSTFEIYGRYRGLDAHFTITGLQGHVLNRDFPESVADWKSIEPIKLFETPTYKYGIGRDNSFVSHLEDLAKGIDIVMFWLDYDMEGENICFQVLDVIHNKINQLDFRQYYRVQFSSLEYNDIIKAFYKKDESLNADIALRAEAKHIFDLKVGVAFTRQLTNTLKKELGPKSNAIVSFGPCQNPTLALVVKRYEEIKNFKERSWFIVTAELLIKTKSEEKSIKFVYSGPNCEFKSQQEAKDFINKSEKKGKIISNDII